MTREWAGKSAADLVKIKEDYKRDVNATGEVPSLRAGGQIVTESDVVAEFLEDAYPSSGTSLMPSDAVERSRVRQYLKILGGPGGVQGMYSLLMNQDPSKDVELRNKVWDHWKAFAHLASVNGPYFLGAQFSLADLLVMPMYDQFRFLWKHYRGTVIIPTDASAYPWAPRMHAWAQAVEARESFRAFSQGEDVYIKAYAGYAGARGVSSVGN